jgi:hypothetical protein
VIAGSLALFLIMLAFLTVQLRAGRDPALGTGVAPAKRVLVRREEKQVIVTRVLRDDGGSGSDDGTAPSAVAAVPAPAPAAPAPASPPVSTASS